MGGSVAMVYLVIIPLLGFGLFFIIFKVRPIFSRVFHKYDALNESVEENVTGMRVVKSYVREDFEKEKFATAARDVQMDFTRAEKLLAFNNPMMNICANGAFVVNIYLGPSSSSRARERCSTWASSPLDLYRAASIPREPDAAVDDLCHG